MAPHIQLSSRLAYQSYRKLGTMSKIILVDRPSKFVGGVSLYPDLVGSHVLRVLGVGLVGTTTSRTPVASVMASADKPSSKSVLLIAVSTT